MGRLKTILKKHSGRDNTGKVSVRHTGGRHKRFYREIDFKRDKHGVVGKVTGIEYDPNRSAEIVLIQYADGDKRYILRPLGLNLGDQVVSGEGSDVKTGNAMPIMSIPVGSAVHNIELTKGRGGQIVRSAGNQAFIVAREEKYVHVKMPSGELRRVFGENYATIGQLSLIEWKDRVLGKAGASRRLGKRPKVRGVAMDPGSHPHGGGEGRTGIGLKYPKTYAGKKAVGKTREKKKYSDQFIIKRRK